MNTFLYWLGALVWLGMLMAALVAVWWFVVTKFLDNAKETWWIAAYACYKRKHGGKESARRALEAAIRCDKRLQDNPNDPEIVAGATGNCYRMWRIAGLISGLVIGVIVGWNFL